MKKSLAPNGHKGKGNQMVTIQYEINGKMIDIEVTEEFAKQYKQIETEEKRINRKETRRHQSLEKYMEKGFNVADERVDIEEAMFYQESINELYSIIKALPMKEKSIIFAYYFESKTFEQIAKEHNVQKPAISKHLKRILEKIKNFYS